MEAHHARTNATGEFGCFCGSAVSETRKLAAILLPMSSGRRGQLLRSVGEVVMERLAKFVQIAHIALK
jgi:hypothetical protein